MPATKKTFSGDDRRKAERRPLLESFGFFAGAPAKGMHRLPVHDVSETGLGLNLDVEGEPQDHFPIRQGESLDLHLYLNQSLYLSLKGKVAWVRGNERARTVGVEFTDKKEAGYRAVGRLVKFLDILHESATLES
jgi:hypothetical protein